MASFKHLSILCSSLLCLTINQIQAAAYNFPFHPPTNMVLEPTSVIVNHPVTTNNEKAQLFFDQGFTLLYAFNHEESYWSFQKAAELDPNMPMAYWGMAQALGPNINMDITEPREETANSLIQKAIKLLDTVKVTENEKDYINALSFRYSDNPKANLDKLAMNYSKAMGNLVKKYPDDLDAAVLYGESLMDLNPWDQWTNNGKPKDNTTDIVSVLESVLKRDPDHLGGNHFYIHAVEASDHPERALMSAERLRHISPSLGHILHMPSHIYILVGDYNLAAICNEQAIAADKEYINQYGIQGTYPLHYMSHNMYFLARAYCLEGKLSSALEAAKELENFYDPHFKEMPELEFYSIATLSALLTFHKWNEILDLPPPNPDMKINTVLWHYGRAMAFASSDQKDNAEKEQNAFLDGNKNLPDNAEFGYNEAKTITKIAQNVLEAKIAEMKGDLAGAVAALKRAVDIQDGLHYNEPPDWYYPIRQSLGAVLFRQQRFKEAEQVFRDDLDKHPRYGRTLFGLLESLKAQSRPTDAWWVERSLRKAWQYSEVPLSISDL